MNKFSKRSVAFATLLVFIIASFTLSASAHISYKPTINDSDVYHYEDYTRFKLCKYKLETGAEYYASINEQLKHFGDDVVLQIAVKPTNNEPWSYTICFSDNGIKCLTFETTETLIRLPLKNIDEYYPCFEGKHDVPFLIAGFNGVDERAVHVIVYDYDSDNKDVFFNPILEFMVDVPKGIYNSFYGFAMTPCGLYSPHFIAFLGYIIIAIAIAVFCSLIVSIINTIRRK